MVRARLAFLTLASGLLASSGCVSTQTSECHSGTSGGWFGHARPVSRTTTAAPCECQGSMPVTMSDGPVVVPPSTFMPPGAFPAPPAIMNVPPAGAIPPGRIVPVPQQANPVPYTPQ